MQSPASATRRPRSIVAAEYRLGSGGAIGTMAGRQGRASDSVAPSAAAAPPSQPAVRQRRFAGGVARSARASLIWAPENGASRSLTPVASKMAFATAAAAGSVKAPPALSWTSGEGRDEAPSSLPGTGGAVRGDGAGRHPRLVVRPAVHAGVRRDQPRHGLARLFVEGAACGRRQGGMGRRVLRIVAGDGARHAQFSRGRVVGDFGHPGRPALDRLRRLLDRAGIGEAAPVHHRAGIRGARSARLPGGSLAHRADQARAGGVWQVREPVGDRVVPAVARHLVEEGFLCEDRRRSGRGRAVAAAADLERVPGIRRLQRVQRRDGGIVDRVGASGQQPGQRRGGAGLGQVQGVALQPVGVDTRAGLQQRGLASVDPALQHQRQRGLAVQGQQGRHAGAVRGVARFPVRLRRARAAHLDQFGRQVQQGRQRRRDLARIAVREVDLDARTGRPGQDGQRRRPGRGRRALPAVLRGHQVGSIVGAHAALQQDLASRLLRQVFASGRAPPADPHQRPRGARRRIRLGDDRHQVLAHEDLAHARARQRRRRIDALQACAAIAFAIPVERGRQDQARMQQRRGAGHGDRFCNVRHQLALSLASSTARRAQRMISTWVPQRHRLKSSSARICCSVASGQRSSRALRVMIIPFMQ